MQTQIYLNPMEVDWEEMERFSGMSFKTVSADYLMKLRVPRVIKAVIKAKGDHFEETKTEHVLTYFPLFLFPTSHFIRYCSVDLQMQKNPPQKNHVLLLAALSLECIIGSHTQH